MLNKKEIAQVKRLRSKGASNEVCINLLIQMTFTKCAERNILTRDRQSAAIADAIMRFIYEEGE